MSDAELIEFASQFRKGILGRRSSELMCFAVCAPLVTLLNMHGVACEIVESDLERVTDIAEHYWLRLKDGRALDPTADQFGLPPVYLGAPTKFHPPPPA